nr:MAG TPA: hypothetical protein [Caudoviricetes sp.]
MVMLFENFASGSYREGICRLLEHKEEIQGV